MPIIKWLTNLLKTILSVFRPQPKPQPIPQTPSFSHPEEPVNPSQTVANTDIPAVITKWLTDWKVPVEYWDFWRSQIQIHIYDEWTQDVITKFGIQPGWLAFATIEDGKPALYCKASYFNAGVVAHEMAHNTYYHLLDTDQVAFKGDYEELLHTDSQLQYFATQRVPPNNIELHAEVYRFLGETTPAQLKHYYPKLF